MTSLSLSLSLLPSLSLSLFLSLFVSISYSPSLSFSLFFFNSISIPIFFSLNLRLNNTAGQFKCDSKLEISILNYFKSFKKVYMADTANMGMSIVPGGTYTIGRSVSHCILFVCLCVPLCLQRTIIFLFRFRLE